MDYIVKPFQIAELEYGKTHEVDAVQSLIRAFPNLEIERAGMHVLHLLRTLEFSFLL